MGHWLAHFFGLDDGSGTPYLFWSGLGSDITEFIVLGGIWKAMNCHEYRCLRIGTKTTVEPNGHHYRRCTKHHKERHA